jgi:hypothetical protein
VRFARAPRADGTSAVPGDCSGEDSRGFALRFRVGAVDGRDEVGLGGEGGPALEEPVDSLAEERVTLDDMRFCFYKKVQCWEMAS